MGEVTTGICWLTSAPFPRGTFFAGTLRIKPMYPCPRANGIKRAIAWQGLRTPRLVRQAPRFVNCAFERTPGEGRGSVER